MKEKGSVLFYEDENDNVKIEVMLQDEMVWLNVESISRLFNVQRPAITKHIKNIYDDGELNKNSTCSKMEQVQKEGTREVVRIKHYYNIDMIISIDFRVNSKKAIKFRTWANKIIKDYLIKGYNINADRFKNNGNNPYFENTFDTNRKRLFKNYKKEKY